jgi:hypothetical protein
MTRFKTTADNTEAISLVPVTKRPLAPAFATIAVSIIREWLNVSMHAKIVISLAVRTMVIIAPIPLYRLKLPKAKTIAASPLSPKYFIKGSKKFAMGKINPDILRKVIIKTDGSINFKSIFINFKLLKKPLLIHPK